MTYTYETIKLRKVSLVDMVKNMQVENVAIVRTRTPFGETYLSQLEITFSGRNDTDFRPYEAGLGMHKLIIAFPSYIRMVQPVVPKSLWGFIDINDFHTNVIDDDGTFITETLYTRASIDIKAWKRKCWEPRWVVYEDDINNHLKLYKTREEARKAAKALGMRFKKLMVAPSAY